MFRVRKVLGLGIEDLQLLEDLLKARVVLLAPVLNRVEVHTVDGRNPFRTTLKTGETILGWYCQGNHHSNVYQVVQDFVHPQSVLASVVSNPLTRGIYPFWREGYEHQAF